MTIKEKDKSNAQGIRIDLEFATLVVEKSIDPFYPGEVYVTLESKDDGCIQDIVTVGRKYHYTEGDCPVFDDEICVKVWSDKDSEDYTHSFEITPYIEDSSAGHLETRR